MNSSTSSLFRRKTCHPFAVRTLSLRLSQATRLVWSALLLVLICMVGTLSSADSKYNTGKLIPVGTFGQSHFSDGLNFWRARFAPDGKTLITVSDNTRITGWNLDSGQHRWDWIKGNTDSVGTTRDMEFFTSKPGLAVTCSDSGSVYMFETATGKVHKRLGKLPYWVTALAVSPNERYVAAVDLKGNWKVWDLKTGALKTFANPPEYSRLSSVTFSPDGRWLVLGGMLSTTPSNINYNLGVITRLDMQGGDPFSRAEAITGFPMSLDFSPDGRHLAAGLWGGQLMVLDGVEFSTVWKTRLDQNWVGHVRFFKDNKTLLACSMRDVHEIDIASREIKTRLQFTSNDDIINDIDISPDGKLLAVTVRDHHKIHLFARHTWKRITAFAPASEAWQHLAFTKDETSLLHVPQGSPTWNIYHTKTWRVKQRTSPLPLSDKIFAVAIDPTQRYAFVAAAKHATAKAPTYLQILSWPSLAPLPDAKPIAGSAAHFTPDGNYILLRNTNKPVAYRAATGKKVDLNKIPKKWRAPLSHISGDILRTMWGSRSVYEPALWTPLAQQLLQRDVDVDVDGLLPEGFGGISLKSNRYAALNRYRRPVVSELETGTPIFATTSWFPDFTPNGLAISPTGQTLAVGGADGRVRIFRIQKTPGASPRKPTPSTLR